MLWALFLAAATSTAAEPAASFDGYALGMTVAEAEAVPPGRRGFECGKLMTSRCIVYDRRIGQTAATITVHFALDDRRINQVEIVPKDSGRSGGTSCEAAWSSLVSGLTVIYGPPQSREGNTVRWRTSKMALTATVLQQQDEDAFCDVAASLTSADRP